MREMHKHCKINVNTGKANDEAFTYENPNSVNATL